MRAIQLCGRIRQAGRLWPGVVRLLAAMAIISGAAAAEPLLPAAPAPPEIAVLERQATELFQPSTIVGAETPFGRACGELLLFAQAISVMLIVAAMIAKVRRDHEQLEGIAAVVLKVAFIATIPLWQSLALQTADTTAGALSGNPPVVSGAVLTKQWKLAREWMPASSPYLDALDEQNAVNVPSSGQEEPWSLRAWNWARGVTDTGGDAFGVAWHALAGGLRAFAVFFGCAALAFFVLVTLLFGYAVEVLRLLVFHGGCAIAPVFIAALALEAMQQQALRFLFALVAIAFWPVVWALANLAIAPVIERTTDWMRATTRMALDLPTSSESIPPLATAAPMVAWGILLALGALTVVGCALSLCGTVVIPYFVTKSFTAGALRLTTFAGASTSGVPLDQEPKARARFDDAAQTREAVATESRTQPAVRVAPVVLQRAASLIDGSSPAPPLEASLGPPSAAATEPRPVASWLDRRPRPDDSSADQRGGNRSEHFSA